MTPERQNIVKTRIAEHESKANEPNSNLSDTQATTQSEQANTENESSKNHEITQEEIDNYNNTQPMPDTDGCVSFILCMAIGFGLAFLALVSASMSGNRSAGFHDLKIITVLPYLKYVPIGAILFFYFITRSNRVRDYWLNHLKLALAIASFFAVSAVSTFITGTYSGIYRNCTGTPAYMLAVGILVLSMLFIANAFQPISKKYRPKNGLTLAALALVLETIIR